MDYDFPVIEDTNQVLPHIEGRDEFLVMKKDFYTVINYAVAFEETFEWDENDPVGSAIRRECRGLVFDVNGEIVSRPYHKFFNVNEREETQFHKINLNQPHVVLEKLDGSMIRVIPASNGFRLATKSGITDIAMSAEVFIATKPHYFDFIRFLDLWDMTPIFEWLTPNPKQRIVVEYKEKNLVLTGIRYLYSGKYVAYEQMKDFADKYNIPCVQVIDGFEVQDIELYVNQIREWEGKEGVVIRFDNGHMIKIKADDYVLRHKIRSFFNSEKTILQIIVEDKVDDVIPLLYENDANRLRAFQTAFWMAIEDVGTDIHDAYCLIQHVEDQKEFATIAVPTVPEQYQPFMFRLRKGHKVKDLILDRISKSLSTSNKINSNRWLFGNLNWNNVNS
jgi:RNA ligase